MLHVEQYRYPNGPPKGNLSSGTGALIGDDTGAIIPGSIIADIHNVITVNVPKTTDAQNTALLLSTIQKGD